MDTFFGLHIPAHTTGGMALALILAVALGGLIGLERELHGHPAGLRTHILVCVGSTLFTLISVQIGAVANRPADPGRIAAQIVTGIGFLGAGAIIREGASIRGLTTAASIWTTAAVGLAVGTGPRYGELAVIATGIVLFTLWILNGFEDWLEIKGRRALALEIRLREGPHATETVLARLAAHGAHVRALRVMRGNGEEQKRLFLRVKVPADLNRAALLAALTAEPDVLSVQLE